MHSVIPGRYVIPAKAGSSSEPGIQQQQTRSLGAIPNEPIDRTAAFDVTKTCLQIKSVKDVAIDVLKEPRAVDSARIPDRAFARPE